MSRVPSISMGLDAIFSVSAQNKPAAGIQHILVSQIQPSPFQARKVFSDTAIAELASSISQHGLLQPIIVRQIRENQYELLAGERRLRAMRQLNKLDVPAIICAVDDPTAMAFGLIENIQRQNLNPIEEAAAYERLLHEFQLSHDALSEKIGKSRSHITNTLRLNRLPDAVKKYLINDEISMGHARAILSLPEEKQTEIAELIIQRDMSVRQTEACVKQLFASSVDDVDSKVSFVVTDALKSKIVFWQKKLAQKYIADIKINFDQAGRGRVILEAESEEALAQLMDRLV